MGSDLTVCLLCAYSSGRREGAHTHPNNANKHTHATHTGELRKRETMRFRMLFTPFIFYPGLIGDSKLPSSILEGFGWGASNKKTKKNKKQNKKTKH